MTPTDLSRQLIARLWRIPALEGVPADQVSTLAGYMTSRSLNPGEVLVVEGAAGSAWFVLLEGRVRLSRRTLDGDTYTVAELDGGDTPSFGELALLGDVRHGATVEALRESDLVAIDRADFERFGEEHPGMALRILRNLARQATGELARVQDDAALLFETLVNEVRSKTAK